MRNTWLRSPRLYTLPPTEQHGSQLLCCPHWEPLIIRLRALCRQLRDSERHLRYGFKSFALSSLYNFFEIVLFNHKPLCCYRLCYVMINRCYVFVVSGKSLTYYFLIDIIFFIHNSLGRTNQCQTTLIIIQSIQLHQPDAYGFFIWIQCYFDSSRYYFVRLFCCLFHLFTVFHSYYTLNIWKDGFLPNRDLLSTTI